MSDTSPEPENDRTYRAVSPWAALGLVLSVLYAVGLLVVAVLAFRSGAPLLLSPLTFLVPVVAAALSVAGWVQVRRSEGQRVGLRLARAGVFVSALFGLSYASYWYLTEQALRLQARTFTADWLEQAQRSGTNESAAAIAFWDTLDPITRLRAGDLGAPEVRQKLAEDPKTLQAARAVLRGSYFWGDRGLRGPLPLFPDNELVARVRLGGGQTTVESTGLRSWNYLPGSRPGYRLEQEYRITTPEGVFEVVIPVFGTDLERRQWQVLLNEVEFRKIKLSAFGGRILDLRLDSRRFAADWARKLAEGKSAEAFLDTLPPASRAEIQDDAEKVRNAPAFGKFQAGALLQSSKLEATDAEVATAVTRVVPQLFAGPFPKMQIPGPDVLPASPWKMEGNEVTFFQPFEMVLSTGSGKYRCTGVVAVATTDANLLHMLREAEQAGPQSAELPRLPRQPSWRIVGVELETAAPATLGGE